MTSGPALEIVTERIVTERHGTRTVVRLRGELDLGSDADVRREISAVLDRDNPHTLVLDLSGLTFTDSTGLGTMVWAHKRMAERGHQLLLADPGPLVRRLLHISGLDKQLRLSTESGVAGSTEDPPASAPRGTSPLA